MPTGTKKPPAAPKPKDPRHVPAKGEKLQPGRTDLYIGDLVVAWIEWFPDAALGYVRHATGDGAFATIWSGDAVAAVDIVRRLLPAGVRPLLKISLRVGTARTWAEANKPKLEDVL
jgi:hypothetical protein